MDRIIAVFVEGATEVEFYKALIENLRKCHENALLCKFEFKNLRGIGNFKLDAGRQLDALRKKHPNDEIYVFLCVDTDAFEFSKNPPVNLENVKKSLINKKANKVFVIKAKRSIEDWFMCDFEGIIRYLHLPEDTKKPSGIGQEALKALFKKKNRVYAKGMKVEGLIDSLDMIRIMKKICCEIKPLCKSMGVDCDKVCNRK